MTDVEWTTRRNELVNWVLSPPTSEETRDANWHELRMRRANRFTVPSGQVLRKYSPAAEVWCEEGTGWITVIGDPSEWVWDEEDHNCDAMGCGSHSHVVMLHQLPGAQNAGQ